LNGLEVKLQEDIINEKQQIDYLSEELKKYKYSKNEDEENFKIYELEAEYLKEEKITSLKDQN
jgi:hypothetical protein